MTTVYTAPLGVDLRKVYKQTRTKRNKRRILWEKNNKQTPRIIPKNWR